MADSYHQPKYSRPSPLLRLDSTTLVRRSLDMSPSRASLQSSRVQTPSPSIPSTPISAVRAPSPEKQPLRPEDSNTFLTSLAAQERRVLELREELQKAEVDLLKLKKQWASYETTKKRDELRHLEQLQSLKTNLGGSVGPRDDDPCATNRDLDRRKMAPPVARPSPRTIFSGSRHTRALSLLSPKEAVPDKPPLPRTFGLPEHQYQTLSHNAISTTIEELSASTDGSNDSNSHPGPSKDLILETGKQIVGDFRQGFWTFFEDLKQVTVGDEAATTPEVRGQRSFSVVNQPKSKVNRTTTATTKTSPALKSRSVDPESSPSCQQAGSSHSRRQLEEPVETKLESSPETSATHSRLGSVAVGSSDSDDDEWDNWDDAKGLTSHNETADLMLPPTTGKSSPGMNTGEVSAAFPKPARRD